MPHKAQFYALPVRNAANKAWLVTLGLGHVMTLMAKPDSNHDATPKLKLKKVDLALKKLKFAPTNDK